MSMHSYFSDIVGGRVAVSKAGGHVFETGGTIIHSSNRYENIGTISGTIIIRRGQLGGGRLTLGTISSGCSFLKFIVVTRIEKN